MTAAGGAAGEVKFAPSDTSGRPQKAWGVPDTGLLRLAHLSHAVVAPGVEERLRIELRDIVLPPHPGGQGHLGNAVYDELRCKAYVGPARALFGSDGRPDKSRLKEARLEVSGHQAAAEVDLGVPEPQEPWALRMKLYRRPASNLFAQEKCAEFVEALPCPRSAVQLPGPSGGRQVGAAQVEVLRLVPAAAADALQEACGRVLAQAVDAGVEAEDVEKLCLGARELGPETLRRPEAAQALLAAAKLGKHAVVEKLLSAGVRATLAAARAAEQAGEHLLASRLFSSAEGAKKSEVLLRRAVEERMPFVAEQILKEDATALQGLDQEAARKAHAAGAWTVLAALLDRGDPAPAQPRLLLDYALRAGHAGLARSCLAHLGEDTRDMDLALRTCLDHGRTEIVREALEVMWKARSGGRSEGPPLLELEGGTPDHPAECSICFEELYTNPGVYVNEHGLRVCGHFTCLNCAEHVQDEAGERFRAWRARREPRIPRPPGPVCPLCRAPFEAAVRLTDPTVDPKAFFRLACVPEDADANPESLTLKEKFALSTLGALLPVNVSNFAATFQSLWPAWCDADLQPRPEGLREADFLRPGGMLAWLSGHLLELKVQGQLGQPPRLDCPETWFRHFDFQNSGRLTKSELLRGVVKAFDCSQLAAPGTPSRRARSAGVLKLRDLVEAVWDEERWASGVPLEDFLGSSGLAERLRAALPQPPPPQPGQASGPASRSAEKPPTVSVEEALRLARASDFKTVQEDEARAKVRAEKQRQPLTQSPSRDAEPRRPGGPPQGGAQVLLASLLEAAREEGRLGATRQLRIQCPFCGVVNAARASERHRVICGACRSVFAVPSLGRR
ncbi:unnamed protein product [Symbiodinium microadriaticum]|nr:unnamed protein product [Symbiodinium microadriaticum]